MSIKVVPYVAKLNPGATQQFYGVDENKAVAGTWSVKSPAQGSIDAAGLYTSSLSPSTLIDVIVFTSGGKEYYGQAWLTEAGAYSSPVSSGGGGTVDTVSRAADTANKLAIESVRAVSSQDVPAGETRFIAGGLWKNPTAAAITVPGTTTSTALTGAGLVAFAGSTQVDEVVLSASTDLSGAAPAGAKFGINLATGKQFVVSAGNWAAEVVAAAVNSQFYTITRATNSTAVPTTSESGILSDNFGDTADVLLLDGRRLHFRVNVAGGGYVLQRTDAAPSLSTYSAAAAAATLTAQTLNIVPVSQTNALPALTVGQWVDVYVPRATGVATLTAGATVAVDGATAGTSKTVTGGDHIRIIARTATAYETVTVYDETSPVVTRAAGDTAFVGVINVYPSGTTPAQIIAPAHVAGQRYSTVVKNSDGTLGNALHYLSDGSAWRTFRDDSGVLTDAQAQGSTDTTVGQVSGKLLADRETALGMTQAQGNAGTDTVPRPISGSVLKGVISTQIRDNTLPAWQVGFAAYGTGKTPTAVLHDGAIYRPIAATIPAGSIPKDNPTLWENVSRDPVFTGATATTDGVRGSVPAPVKGEEDAFLRGDGTWASLSITGRYIGSAATFAALPTTDAVSGDWAALSADEVGTGTAAAPQYKRGIYLYNGTAYTFAVALDAVTIANLTGATATVAGTAGLVPAPAAGKEAAYLRGDATWAAFPDAPASLHDSGVATATAITVAGTSAHLEGGAGYSLDATKLTDAWACRVLNTTKDEGSVTFSGFKDAFLRDGKSGTPVAITSPVKVPGNTVYHFYSDKNGTDTYLNIEPAGAAAATTSTEYTEGEVIPTGSGDVIRSLSIPSDVDPELGVPPSVAWLVLVAEGTTCPAITTGAELTTALTKGVTLIGPDSPDGDIQVGFVAGTTYDLPNLGALSSRRVMFFSSTGVPANLSLDVKDTTFPRLNGVAVTKTAPLVIPNVSKAMVWFTGNGKDSGSYNIVTLPDPMPYLFLPAADVTAAIAGHPTVAEFNTWLAGHTGVRDQFVYYTGTATNTDTATNIWYVDRAGLAKHVKVPDGPLVFLSSASITTATAGRPTLAEFRTWLTGNATVRDQMVWYNATTAQTAEATYVWYVDRSGSAQVLRSPEATVSYTAAEVIPAGRDVIRVLSIPSDYVGNAPAGTLWPVLVKAGTTCPTITTKEELKAAIDGGSVSFIAPETHPDWKSQLFTAAGVSIAPLALPAMVRAQFYSSDGSAQSFKITPATNSDLYVDGTKVTLTSGSYTVPGVVVAEVWQDFAGGVAVAGNKTYATVIKGTAGADTIQTLTAAGTVTAWSSLVLVNSATAVTVTLPAAVAASIGKRVRIKNLGTAVVTIAANGSDTLSGATTLATGDAHVYETTAAAAVHRVDVIVIPVARNITGSGVTAAVGRDNLITTVAAPGIPAGSEITAVTATGGAATILRNAGRAGTAYIDVVPSGNDSVLTLTQTVWRRTLTAVDLVGGAAINVNNAASVNIDGTAPVVGTVTIPADRMVTALTATNATVLYFNSAGGFTILPSNAGNVVLTVTTNLLLPGNTRIMATANRGIDVSIGTLRFRLAGSGNTSMQVSSGTGASISATVFSLWSNGGKTDGTFNMTIPTTPTYVMSSWNFGSAGDWQRAVINDTTNGRWYDLTMIIGSSYTNNSFLGIEMF